MSNNETGLLSIIFLSYHSGDRIISSFEAVKEELEKEHISFEFIIIDDGSKDDSYNIALELEQKDKRVKAYQLSKNFTSHNALFAGLSLCRGNCAAGLADDLQLPVSVLIKMYRIWEKGQKIVIPFRASRDDGWLNDKFSNFYYKLMNNISDVVFPKGGADNFLIDKEIIDIINNRISPVNTSIIVEILRLGFDPVFIPFDRPKSNSKSRWRWRKKLKLAFDTIFSSSSFPIKMITFLGLVSLLFSFTFIFFIVSVKLFADTTFLGFSIPGWATTVIFISFFSGLILFSLGVIAEYIWRIYEEVKGRPGYIIKRKNKPHA